MFKFVQCAVALGAALLWAQPASADLVKTSNVAVSITGTGSTYVGTSVGLNNDLTLGVQKTISDFITIKLTNISSSNPTGSVSVDFTFTNPVSATQTVTGSITGTFASSNEKTFSVTWGAPLSVTFSNGQKLLIDLVDTTSNCTGNCRVNDSIGVTGNFTLSAAAVPGPVVGAGLPGLLAAFAGLLAWRRRKAANA